MSRPTFDQGFSTEELTEIYSASSTVEAILEFEEGLVLALADAVIAPAEEAEEVATACRGGVDDPEAILASTWETGTPITALRDELDGGEWFHHGATSQDAIDTGQLLQARRALDVIGELLESMAGRLGGLVTEHRDLPHMGRTFLQDARPMTFGFRLATWLDSVLDHIEDLRDQRERLAVQLGGPVGTMDVYGEKAADVMEALSERLGLAVPGFVWHTNRSRVVALAQSVERTAMTMAKIGTDVAVLSSTPVGEISVRSGGSSSMPGKENPLDAIRAVAAASACTGAVTMLTSAPPHELDRGIGGWHVEWIALPLVFQTAGATCEAADTALESLQVNPDAMSLTEGSIGPEHQIDRTLERLANVLGS